MTNKHNVLIIGSGGREHAFAFKISQSNLLDKLFIAPGNAGTSMLGTNVSISENDFESIKKLVIEKNISLVIVGPEVPLVNGISNFFAENVELKSVTVIGPDAAGAMLEGSKDFSKQFMMKHHVPTAAYQSFTKENIDDGYIFLERLKAPYVLKASGLAAGKGVLILEDLDEAKNELSQMLNGMFGESSETVVIEEFLNGIELSVFVLTDGISYKILPTAKDYKRIGDNDTGLNTGGMGAIAPVPFADAEFMKKVETEIITPTINGLKNDGINYKGFLFIGIMNCNGKPVVIEYNCRMGDPETEAVLPLIESDLLKHFLAVGEQSLENENFSISNKTSATIVIASGGYPGNYSKGLEITFDDTLNDSIIFHSGTKQVNDSIVTNGGRVLAITSMANGIEDAVAKSYATINTIRFNEMYYRKDIGKDLLKFKN
jgi:phosphoribosylamine--glycine ligase